tara:strand:+ start:145 stop:1050 length:906 start_codon:yes stop_codon:yes gene_type:complete
MQTKTIKKVIIKKMNAWLESITNNDLRKRVKDNLLVSGGSIASMFLKEDVNDYDIYIQDMDVLRDLAEYYCNDKVLDGRFKEKYLAERFPEIVANNGMIYDDGILKECLSEHYVRINNLKPDQVKLDISGAGEKIKIAEEDNDNYLVVFLSQNAISLSNDVQIVLRFNGTVDQVHKTFDFMHATNYFTFKDGLVLNEKALESLLTKELKYQGSLYPLTSIIRMKKFILRGWSINAGEILKIMFQISELDLKNIKVLEEQLIGVDVAYFSALIEILRGVSPDKLSASFINEQIDKVFNYFEE